MENKSHDDSTLRKGEGNNLGISTVKIFDGPDRSGSNVSIGSVMSTPDAKSLKQLEQFRSNMR